MYDTFDTILCCWNLYDPFVGTEGSHGGENAWADVVRILAILRARSIRAVFDNPGIQFSAVGKCMIRRRNGGPVDNERKCAQFLIIRAYNSLLLENV